MTAHHHFADAHLLIGINRSAELRREIEGYGIRVIFLATFGEDAQIRTPHWYNLSDRTATYRHAACDWLAAAGNKVIVIVQETLRKQSRGGLEVLAFAR